MRNTINIGMTNYKIVKTVHQNRTFIIPNKTHQHLNLMDKNCCAAGMGSSGPSWTRVRNGVLKKFWNFATYSLTASFNLV